MTNKVPIENFNCNLTSNQKSIKRNLFWWTCWLGKGCHDVYQWWINISNDFQVFPILIGPITVFKWENVATFCSFCSNLYGNFLFKFCHKVPKTRVKNFPKVPRTPKNVNSKIFEMEQVVYHSIRNLLLNNIWKRKKPKF